MKRITLVVVSLVVSFGVALGVVGVAQASWSDNLRFADSGTVTIEGGQTHQGALYASGNKLVIDGTIDGDLYCMVGELIINGTVNGDILCAAQTVSIYGEVGQDVRLAAQYAIVDGGVAGSLSTLAQDVRVGAEAQVGHELNGANQTATVDGAIGGGVALASQAFRLNGQVDGNVDVSGQLVHLGTDSRIAGDLNYSAASRELSNVDRVDGEVSYIAPERTGAGYDMFSGLLIVVLSLVLSAVVVVMAVPRFVHRSSELLRKQSLMTVLLGFAVVFGAPAVMLMTLLTVFLIPLMLMLLLAYLLVMLLSAGFFAYFIGSVLLRGVENIVLRMLGGAVVLLILYMIPFVQVLAISAALVVGSGMIVATLTNGYRRPEYSLAGPVKPARTSAKKK